MALKDFPEIEQAFNALRAEKEAILAKSTPLRRQRDAVLEKMQPLIAAEQALAKEYLAIERQRVPEIDAQLAAMALATGGKRLNS